MKIIGTGLIFDKNAYLRNHWNILDFSIVFITLLPMLIGGNIMKVQSVRVFRVLRPLRTVSTIKELKIILSTLISAMPFLCNTLVILFFFYMIFAIAGL